MADEPEVTQEENSELRFVPPLPKQLQAQVDQANQLREQLAGQEQEGGEGEGQEQEGEEGQYEEGEEGQYEEGDPQDTWERRARSANGRLEQALTANQQMAARLAELEQSIATVQLRNGGEVQQPAAPKQRQRYVKDEELQDYGEEFFDVVGRRAKEEFDPVLDQLGERIKRLESGQQVVGRIVEKQQSRSLMEQLTDAVPNWREINHHPKFFEWLAFPDPYSGRQRHEMLKEAHARQDVTRVVNFFKGFLTEATGSPPNEPTGQRSAAPPSPNGNGSGRPSLEDFAAPGRARSAPQPLPPEKPVYTQAQIAQFAADKRRGLYRGREADVEQIERDIYQAQHEGRIV
jgi:hypothetical protein